MSGLSLQNFKDRLQFEIPAYQWECHGSDGGSGEELPEGIEIVAFRDGSQVAGPLHISGSMLKRWGLDATARMVFNEVKVAELATRGKLGLGWDRLAEY